MSFKTIEASEGVETFLEGLAEEVKNRTYRPMPVRRVMIPKPDGSQRPLGIPDKKGDSLLSSPAKPETGKSETVPFLSRWQ